MTDTSTSTPVGEETTVVERVAGMVVETASALLGGAATRPLYFVAYLDDFAVDSAALTDRHKAIMDDWIAGSGGSAFPIRPGSPNQRIRLIAGLASQTGDAAHNVELSQDRANAVHDYLFAPLGEDFLDDNVLGVGTSRPRLSAPGAELAINRAVGVVLEVDVPLVMATPPPPPPSDPPPPRSRHWSLSIHGALSFGTPVEAIGFQYLVGRLRNERSLEERGFRIPLGGLDIGVSASPIDISVNLQAAQLQAFTTPGWVDFDDFDNSVVVFVGASAANVVEFDSTSIGFYSVNAHAEPDGIAIKTNIGAAVNFQFGVFLLDNS